MTIRGWYTVLTFACVFAANAASAQSLGTFRWQLQPYCNVVTVTVVQQGAQYQIDGTDDQCGAPRSAAISGLAFVNPDGSIGFGLHIVTTPGGVPIDIDATIALLTLSGTWSDSAGRSGSFIFTIGAGTGGPPRPTPSTSAADVTSVAAGPGLTGGGVEGDVSLAVDFGIAQRRVTAGCPAGQLMVSVNQDGTVGCQAVAGGGGGDITSITAGAGLSGGGVSGDVGLAVNFAGTGAAASAARSDHRHEVGPSGTAIGGSALATQTSGVDNAAVGYRALTAVTTGSRNTAVGSAVLQAEATGVANTAVGYQALANHTTGNGNVAIGDSALTGLTSGHFHVAIGYGALAALANGGFNGISGNTAVGTSALNLTTGPSNTAAGFNVLAVNTSGSGNTGMGREALSASTTGFNNTAVGHLALARSTTASSTIALGSQAGYNLTTGESNVYIGSLGTTDESNTLRIDAPPLGLTRAFISGIRGRTTGQADAVPVVIDSHGQLGTISSSRRTKEHIEPLGSVSRSVFDLRPVSFTYKQPFADGSTPIQYGLIAEEVEHVLPALVAYGVDGQPETVKYHVLPTLLLAEVQRLERERAAQSEEIAALRAIVADLQRQLPSLKR